MQAAREDDHCDGILSSSRPLVFRTRAAMDVLAQLTSALFDRYRVEREIGRGGMATVYLARDLKHDRQTTDARPSNCTSLIMIQLFVRLKSIVADVADCVVVRA